MNRYNKEEMLFYPATKADEWESKKRIVGGGSLLVIGMAGLVYNLGVDGRFSVSDVRAITSALVAALGLISLVVRFEQIDPESSHEH